MILDLIVGKSSLKCAIKLAQCLFILILSLGYIFTVSFSYMKLYKSENDGIVQLFKSLILEKKYFFFPPENFHIVMDHGRNAIWLS